MQDILGVLSNPIVWGPIIAVLALIFVVRFFMNNYIKVPANQVAVFTGRGKQKVVRGGARFMVPGLERVDFLSLEPFNVEIRLQGVVSKEGVAVAVEAVGLVRYGSTDEMVKTAIERFLTSDRASIHKTLNEILGGILRGIVAKMTVEGVNSDRESLAANIVNEASSALAKIGVEIDTVTIQNITDVHGYLDALGRKRIAEVKRDADVAEADAERETRVQQAAATRESEVAEAEAAAAIAEASRNRDIKIAQYNAEVEAEKAKAAQAGPRAQAEAEQAVKVAQQEARAAEAEAAAKAEAKRAESETQRLAADTVAPAEAARRAAILKAEGERDAAIAMADAEAEMVRRNGIAAAEARKEAASAAQAEGVAEAEVTRAKLLAEAEGQNAIADALNAFDPASRHQQMLPDVLRAYVEATSAAAAPLGNIDSVSIIGGGQQDQGGLFGGIMGSIPTLLAQVTSVLKSQGIDVPAMLQQMSTGSGNDDGGAPAQASAPASPAPAETPKALKKDK